MNTIDHSYGRGERRTDRVRKICEHEDKGYETKFVEVSQVALVKGKA